MYVIIKLSNYRIFKFTLSKMADQDKFIANFENMIYRLFLQSSYIKNIYSSICSGFFRKHGFYREIQEKNVLVSHTKSFIFLKII